MMLALERCVIQLMTGNPSKKQAFRVSPGPRPEDATSSGAEVPAIDHQLWDSVLHRCLSPPGDDVQGISGTALFDYKLVLGDPSIAADMQAYLDLIGAIKPAVFKALTDDERLALFLNAYNALCVNTILRWMREHDGAPPRSINDISTWRKPVWKQRAGKVAGSHVTLDYIEHSVLRTEWAEPRVHACLVCASLSCPNLRGEAYDARRLNAQMDDQTRDWLANTTKGVLVTPSTTDDSKPQITLSRIFLWFRDDFIRGESTAEDSCGAATAEMSPELAFARRYKPEVRDGAITYFPYNWSLNIAS